MKLCLGIITHLLRKLNHCNSYLIYLRMLLIYFLLINIFIDKFIKFIKYNSLN